MNNNTNSMVKSSLFLALGIIIPYIFHASGIPGKVFLPMHIPVLLCGLILGGRYGLIIGAITPIISSVITGMPPIYPVAISMMFELTAYGFISGYFYKKNKWNIFVSLISAMIIGRVIAAICNYFLLSFAGKTFVLKIFLANSFVKATWGILIQLILIPIIVKAIQKNKESVSVNG